MSLTLELQRRPLVAQRVVDELIDPCNVLVNMTDDGKVGFGHLRYREYLVATELISNRSIQVGQFLSDQWWRGTLVLFARMNENLDWLVSVVVETMTLAANGETLRAMIDTAPPAQRREYLKLIKAHSELDQSMKPEQNTDEQLEADIPLHIHREDEQEADEPDSD